MAEVPVEVHYAPATLPRVFPNLLDHLPLLEMAMHATSELVSKMRTTYHAMIDPSLPMNETAKYRKLAAAVAKLMTSRGLVVSDPNYHYENGTPIFDAMTWPSYFSHNSPWYHDFFFGKHHHNFIGVHEQKGPFLISLQCEATQDGHRYFRGTLC